MAFALLSRSRSAAQAACKPVNHRKTASGLRAIKFDGVSHPHGYAPAIQAKLRIGEANNRFEREADRTADEVMRLPDSAAGELCLACENQVQRSARPSATQEAPAVPQHTESRISSLPGRGQPLSQSLRAFFEPRFGCDFSQVRLHSDMQAADAANEMKARAFTVGTDLVFAQGQLSPGTTGGRKLLAHELTHVLQQTGGKTIGSPATEVRASRSDATLQRFSERACLNTICGLNQCKQIGAALALARQYVETSIAAMEEKELSGQTRQAMSWLFQLDDDSQNAYILKILKAIRDALIRNDNNTDVQCESNCYPPGAGAVVTTPDSKTPGTLQDCADTPCTMKICDSFGGLGPSEQAIALVHEAGHLSGLSGDVYRRQAKFRLLSQSEALGNAEHFALFVRALNGVLKSDLRLSVGGSTGISRAGGTTGWFYNGFFDLTLNRPGFRIFNPKLRLSITGYGVKGSGPDDRLEDPKNTVVVESLLTGVEIGKSRGHGGLFGDVLVGGGRAERGGETRFVFTATADLGYRWDRKEVAIGASYIHDTTAAAGFQNVFLVGVSGNFNFLDLINK
jgi:Domain of unknown function (DUF4157)